MASAGSAFEVRAIVPNKVEEQRLRRLLCLRRLLWGRTRTISGCASMEMLRFGDVVLDVGRGLLRDSKGAEVALRPKSLDLLLELARNPGHILSRDELFDAVWPDVTVTEDSIAQCVHEVRRAIGDPEGRILRTIVKRGYCLDVEESVPPTAAPPTAAPEHAPSAQTAEGRPSLVILPFQSIPYDPETEWFADGIVEEITTALSRFRSLFVIARNSAFTFKGQPVDVRDVGQRLGVRYVLEGSVRRALGQLRVTGQLIDAETGGHVWADRYDGVLSDVFELQDQITAAVAGVLEPSIRRAEMQRAVRKPTSDLSVYDLYLRAMPGIYARSKAGYESAKSLLEEAVARDPNFAQARAMLAVLWEFGAYFGWEPDIEAARARAIGLAREALTSDSSDPQVMARCGFVLATLGRAHAEGSALLDRAIAANPNCAEANFRGAWVSVWNGDFATGLARAEINERLDPLSTEANGRTGIRAAAHFFLREFDAAIEAADQAVGRSPDFHAARCILASSLFHVGREEEARAQVAELRRRNPRYLQFLTLANNPFRHKWMAELFLGGLSRAGFPTG
jgi:TolB-like protein